MYDLDRNQLTEEQRRMVDLWEAHLAAEFSDKDAGKSCDTMVEDPYVNHVPVLTGGCGRAQLEHFYGDYFIPQMPDDVEIAPLSRTVGYDRIVDEFVFRSNSDSSIPPDSRSPGRRSPAKRSTGTRCRRTS